MSEEKKVLCGFCGKPIHISEFGGLSKDLGLFHAKCYEEDIIATNLYLKVSPSPTQRSV